VSGTSPPDIRNERIRLTAGWLSNIGVGLIVVGVITPAVHQEASTTVVVSGIVATLVGSGLHWLARRLLGRLR
jgi:hypothetical protein